MADITKIMNIELDVVSPPPAPTYVWRDELNNGTNWTEADDGGVASFSSGGWRANGYVSPYTIMLHGYPTWYMQGLFDVVIIFDIAGATGNPWYQYVRVWETATKGGSNANVGIYRDSSGDYYWRIQDSLGYHDVAISVSFPQTFEVRFLRNSDNSMTIWIKDGGVWKWNGSTDGYTTPTSFDLDCRVSFVFDNGTDRYPDGGFNDITMYAGTWVG